MNYVCSHLVSKKLYHLSVPEYSPFYIVNETNVNSAPSRQICATVSHNALQYAIMWFP